MENLESKYVRAISRAAAILETAKHGLRYVDTYPVDQHVRMLDSITEDAMEIREVTNWRAGS